jgi:hypothetical protein
MITQITQYIPHTRLNPKVSKIVPGGNLKWRLYRVCPDNTCNRVTWVYIINEKVKPIRKYMD